VGQVQRVLRPGEHLEVLPEEVSAACDALGTPWQQPCYRRLGWYLAVESIRHERMWEDRVLGVHQLCQSLPESEASAWCLEGLGWLFADYFGQTPHKFEAIIGHGLPGPEAMTPVARGLGAYMATVYDDPRAADRACDRYDFTLHASQDCRDGALGLWDLRALPLPGGAVEPGRLHQLRP
jgi:hypothetical protein